MQYPDIAIARFSSQGTLVAQLLASAVYHDCLFEVATILMPYLQNFPTCPAQRLPDTLEHLRAASKLQLQTIHFYNKYVFNAIMADLKFVSYHVRPNIKNRTLRLSYGEMTIITPVNTTNDREFWAQHFTLNEPSFWQRTWQYWRTFF